MKPSRVMLMLTLVILPLLVASVAMGADDQATSRAPDTGPLGSGAGFEGTLTPGVIQWQCDMSHFDADSDKQVFGVEFDGYYYYVTGGNAIGGDDTNRVYIWERTGSSCQFLCALNQPTTVGSWGWMDLAYDGTYLYGAEGYDGANRFDLDAFIANCDSLHVYPAKSITLQNPGVNFPGLSGIYALAYDPIHDWFWTARFSSPIYAFDRNGNRMDSIGNTYDVAGLAWDGESVGGPFLWVHSQTSGGGKNPDVKIMQIDLATKAYTATVYSGLGDASGWAGGLCLNKDECLSLVGVSQLASDSLYMIQISDSTLFTHLDTTWVPFAMIGRFANDRPVMGFQITCVAPTDQLKSVTMKSFITKAFSVDTLRLYAETNGLKGLQVPGDTKIKEINTYGLQFDSNDTLVFSNINYTLADSGGNKFYIAVNAHSDSIGAAGVNPNLYNGEKLEVILLPGRIKLTSGRSNSDTVYNRPYSPSGDDSTGFCPRDPATGNPGCRYRLVFDTDPPDFVINYEVGQTCKDDTIDQLDTIIVWASFYEPDLDSVIVQLPFFGFPNFILKTDANHSFRDTLIIPDTNWTMPPAIDVDTGKIVVVPGVDTAGNIFYDSIYFLEPIDTYKPVIDSTLFYLAYDANNDGIAALGDSLGIIVFCENNAKFEVDSVVANLSNFFPHHPTMQYKKLFDVTNNNWIFRGTVYLDPDSSDTIDFAADSAQNVVYITAWDNACNTQGDTAALNKPIDIEKPVISNLSYFYHWDQEVTHWCIGIGDSVWIRADLASSPDVESVWVDMYDAGIDSGLLWAWYPLFDDGNKPVHNDTTPGDLIYNLLWKVGNPPLAQGKDTDNTVPPPVDFDYSVLVKAMDDVGNWDTVRSPQLNRTLDSRRPRPINPDSIQILAMPDAKVQISWGRNADETDAWWFYIDSTTNGTDWGEIGNFWDGKTGLNRNIWDSEILVDGQYYMFRIKTKDNCDNLGPPTVTFGIVTDGTPPNACIVYPDSGGTYGAPFAVKARSEDQDIDSVSLYYRLWPNYPDEAGRGPWTVCVQDMYRPDQGYVFIDSIKCIHDYIGWVELLPLSCDLVGNCQDVDSAYAHACLDDVDGNLVPGHFLFYWDTTQAVVQVVSVNDTIWPQSNCGFNVKADTVNKVVINVVGADPTDLFTIDVRALADNIANRIDYRNDVTMPCTVDVYVQNWPPETQNLYVRVTDQSNGQHAVPYPLIVELCVPRQVGPCITITSPHEWQRIPCSKTDLTCVPIRAEKTPGCPDTLVTQVQFWYSVSTPGPPWNFIAEVLTPAPGAQDDVTPQSYWQTCWNNKGLVQNGDTVYFLAIGFNQYHVVDTSMMVKVFADCSTPAVKLLVEDLFYTCGNHDIPKINCDPLTFKAYLDTSMHDTVDIVDVDFWYKKHSDPDMFSYWKKIHDSQPAHNENIWMYVWNTPCSSLNSNLYYDFRVTARDQAGNRTFDYDEDGKFDDSTFNTSVSFGAGITVFVDNEAPQPAISMVADSLAPIFNVNPDILLGGSGDAYVKAHDPITVWISPLPSEDTCEVYKVEYWLGLIDSTQLWYAIDTVMVIDTTCTDSIWVEPGTGHWECIAWSYDTSCYYDTSFTQEWEVDTSWYHVSTGTNPNHFPITFNPWELPEIIPHYEFEDGWWQGALKAVLYDSLGNSKDTKITLYILDVDPSQALITEPLNDSYVWGDVTLKVKALNAYDICKVVYQYKYNHPDSAWHPVLNGVSESGPYFEVYWHTPGLTDGNYCLRARAMDCSNNWDDSTKTPTICVWVANTQPTVTLDVPANCPRTCPDNPEDTLRYVAGTVELYASWTSPSAPVKKVYFYYKGIFDYPSEWTFIGVDYFPTNGQYSVKWNTSQIADGRYHVKAHVINAAGRENDSDPITISLDNSAPYTQLISIDGNHHPDGMDISRGDVISIEVVAIDSTSNDGWTRCYNSGVTSISVCIANCSGGDYAPPCDTFGHWEYHSYPYYENVFVIDSIVCDREITKCFEVAPAEDGYHTIQWNTSGLEFEGCSGCYYIYVKATDCLGNPAVSESVKVYVSDITAPITTIGGFDDNYIYGYSSEAVKSLLFEYADSGTTSWIPVGWSDMLGIWADTSHIPSCGYYLYKTSWDPNVLANGTYQVRVISHDSCSNQADSLAPWTYITVEDGEITPYNPGTLGDLSFEKNWCVGKMEGIVRQTSTGGTPVMFARYNTSYQCVDMQSELGAATKFAGSFDADSIKNGGVAKFFSSVTVTPPEQPMTGEAPQITYLMEGSFDIVKVKTDLGTHGKYVGYDSVEVTIPDGAVNHDRYIWVAPVMKEWAPPTQPDIDPIGDNSGYATYVSFTDSNYCCYPAGSAISCFRPGKYAKIKIFYADSITTDKEHLAVAWWDCKTGLYKFDNISLDFQGVEGFNTQKHYVEFATTCLQGPFVVVRLLERPCEGTIVVSLRDQDITPYVVRNLVGYTSPTPKFIGLITDNIQGTGAINQSSITFKIDGQRIFDGSQSSCNKWAKGFGNFEYSGYDLVSGLFRAGWSVYNSIYSCYDADHRTPAPGLTAGGHIATITALNSNVQTCIDTANFKVDATPPVVYFEEKCVGSNPEFKVYIIDRESGVNRDSVWIYLSEGPADLSPDQLALMWDNDTTLHVKVNLNLTSTRNLDVLVYEGTKNANLDPSWEDGPVDMVGNKATAFWHRYNVDLTKPTIDLVKPSYRFRRPVLFTVKDALPGCGIYSIKVDECISPTGGCSTAPAESVVYDPQAEILRYYPKAGGVWTQITVKDSAYNTTFKDSIYCIEDYAPPDVKFVQGAVGPNATVKIHIYDTPAGVNWNTVGIDLTDGSKWCVFTPSVVYANMSHDTVTLQCDFTTSNSTRLTAYVYNFADRSGNGSYGKGPADNADNYLARWVQCDWVLDVTAPSLSLLTPPYVSPIRVRVTDAASGVNPTSFEIEQNDVAITTYTFDAASGVLSFTPALGIKSTFAVSAADKVGLIGVLTFNNYDTYGSWTKDDVGPVIDTMLVNRTKSSPPIKIKFTDALSGVCWDNLIFVVNGEEVPIESLTILQDQGLIEYMPEPGWNQIVVTVTDNVGNNSMVWPFWSGFGDLYFTDVHGAHSYPNPFDPRNGITCIQLVLSKSAYVTAKIYDFAGEFVRTLKKEELVVPNQTCEIPWDGRTESGTEVANGTYLCHIKAQDPDNSKMVTAVIKITVLKEDK